MNAVSFPGLGFKFNVDPVAFKIFGGKEVYWYGIIIVAGLILAFYLTIRNGKKVNISADNISDYLLITIPLAIIGSRLYYVLMKWDNYKSNPFEILKIWNGGLAIYGSIIVSVITMIFFCRAKGIRLSDFLDIGVIGLILGQAIGRWGNFVNMEAHGVETKNFLRMGITEGGKYIEVHPTFLYESVWDIIGFIILMIIFRKCRKFSGEVFWTYAAWYGFGRFFIEGLRTDSLMLGPVRVSQALSAVIFVIAIVKLVMEFRKPTCPITPGLYDKKEEVPEEDTGNTDNSQ